MLAVGLALAVRGALAVVEDAHNRRAHPRGLGRAACEYGHCRQGGRR